MNNLTPKSSVYLIGTVFMMGSPLVVASPVVEPTKIPSNESIHGDCVVQDVTLKWDDEGYREMEEEYDFEEYATEMNCELENRKVIVSVRHAKPDWIHFRVELGRFYLWRRNSDDTTLLDLDGWDSGDEARNFDNAGGIKNIIISLQETYNTKDFFDDLADDEKLKLEFEGNDQKIYIYNLEFDGAKNAVKEFRKRVKSLQEPNNENR
ncbi:MAG: hypothetical protein OXG88_05365 [Gammaproteobacteria bacterium]|nr:hypothetical protein [Gammaproteobacteria bacterium]